MGWTDWSMLAVGVGIGTLGNWWISRKLPQEKLLQKDFQPVQADASNSSELQQLQTQLLQTRLIYEKAKEAEQFKAGFLARTAHELRSPLNRVMSLQQLIMADLCEDPAEEREFIAQAYTAAQEMLAVMDQLISVSKASYGTEQLQIQPVCLEDVFMEVESLTLLQARNRSQQLKIEYPDSDVWVMADPRWLRQVLVSLVDTPMSLMQEGTIRVTPQTVPETQMVQVLIEDERPARFWSEPIDLLQALYHRGSLNVAETNKTAIPGLEQLPSPGLSLFVNQTVLELMGGSLKVLTTPSETDLVTRIQCAIPLATEEL
jgi:signal transduction histidine kinase